METVEWRESLKLLEMFWKIEQITQDIFEDVKF